ncbi:MAG: two-component sensor histidine kinase [Betaproteobacteria bacterium HGW-Betaproteobacteria-9]|jgi:signal transduction histidine kinase|nr:MAG: two-component sensor histidine kinase [Betaproteobacteria bacterium HGW-Betaproteobacteria-9]
MRNTQPGLGWWIGGTVVSLTGAVLIAHQAIGDQRALFETDARIVHRLLSQQVVQHDAILDTLALLQPGPDSDGATPPEQRLPALYPHILMVQRRARGADWPDTALAEAEARSAQNHRPALAGTDLTSGRYRLVLAALPASYALTIDLRGMVPWSEWPMTPQTSAVQVRLEHEGQRFELQAGDATALATGAGWRFEFHKHLAAASQPFDVVARQQLRWTQLPWGLMLLWTASVAAVLALLAQWQRQLTARRRAEELLRLGQVARLNTLGELAAGMAHELNQPLTAVLANTQAAQRLLADDPPELDTARLAMTQAAAQARRAADVVGRLRTAVERPQSRSGTDGASGVVELGDALQRALHLLDPECRRRGVTHTVQAPKPVRVSADPVAVDQIVHNLLINALQAMESVEIPRRVMTLSVEMADRQGALRVSDRGPGIAPDALPHLFEPFFSTREGGLGLGLPLCETLAQGMGGSLTAANRPDGGAEFVLCLPLHPAA